jgi:hypothetical protein
MSDLERELTRLRAEAVWPPTPDLAGAVAARIAAEPQSRRPRLGIALGGASVRRPAPVAVAAIVALVVLVAALAATPSVRARISDWLGIGAVRVERVDRLPPVATGRGLALGERTTLASARDVAAPTKVPTVTALGAPDAVFVDRSRGVPIVSLVYRPRAGLPRSTAGVGALLTVIPGADIGFLKKILGIGSSVEGVDVDGAFGVFISGDPHVLDPPSRLAGNTVVWLRGDTTYRLESALGRDAALRLARSVR